MIARRGISVFTSLLQFSPPASEYDAGFQPRGQPLDAFSKSDERCPLMATGLDSSTQPRLAADVARACQGSSLPPASLLLELPLACAAQLPCAPSLVPFLMLPLIFRRYFDTPRILHRYLHLLSPPPSFHPRKGFKRVSPLTPVLLLFPSTLLQRLHQVHYSYPSFRSCCAQWFPVLSYK